MGRIGVSANTIFSEYMAEQGTPVASLDHELDAANALLGGEVDAVMVDHRYAVQKLAQCPGLLEIVGPRVQLDQGLGRGVRPGSELKDRFDERLAAMKADGTLCALIIEWLGAYASTFG